MTVHFPQTPEAITDARTTQSVVRHMLNPTSNSTTMGAVQDTITGMHMLTSKATFLEREEFMHLMCASEMDSAEMPVPAILYKDRKTGARKCLYTGKQMASMCMRGTRAAYRHCTDKSLGEEEALFDEATAVVRDGEMLCGTLDKKALGPNKNLSIVHVVALFVGCKLALDMLFHMQRVVHTWMMWQGFSIRLRDVTVSEATELQIERDIAACEESCDRIRSRGLALGIDAERIEEAVVAVIQACNENVTKRVTTEATADGSTTMTMISCGAKGTTANIKQMGGSVGQQKSEGARLHLPGGERYLSCFPWGYEGIEARGAIRPSYMSGLNAYEMYYASKVAITSVVKKTTATSITGFFERRMIKMMEDFIARTRCAMGATGRIVQMRFGGDGCDSRRLCKVGIENVLKRGRGITVMQCWGHKELSDAVFGWQKSARRVYVSSVFPTMPSMALLPFEARKLFDVKVSGRVATEDLGHRATAENVLKACDTFYISVQRFVGHSAASVACLHLSEFVLGFNRHGVMWSGELKRLVVEAESMKLRALVESGEAVGIVAGQSVSSHCTQLMLDAPHPGGGDKTVTQQGVPRLNEIVNGSVTRTPVMRVAVKQAPTTRQLSSLVTIRLSVLTTRRRSYVVEDPVVPGATTRKGRDRDFLDMSAACFGSEAMLCGRLREGDAWKDFAHARFLASTSSRRRTASSASTPASRSRDEMDVDGHMAPPEPSKFVLRIELDRKRCERYAMKPRNVARVISRHTDVEFCTVQYSDALSDLWIVRVRPWFTADDAKNGERVFLENLKDSLLSSVAIGGVGDIKSAKMSTRQCVETRADGSLEERTLPCVVTEGSCLASVARMPWVDWRNTMTNDIVEVRGTLGIWAARSVMLKQMHQVLFAQDGYVDQRHIQMLIDSQFRTGTFSKLNGSNIATADTGPLQRCLFETQFNVLTEAGALSFMDKMDGVTQPLIMGELPPVGTGAFALLSPYVHGMVKPRKAASKFGHLMSKQDKADIVRESAGASATSAAGADGFYATTGRDVLARGRAVPLPTVGEEEEFVVTQVEEDAAEDVAEEEAELGVEGEAFRPASP